MRMRFRIRIPTLLPAALKKDEFETFFAVVDGEKYQYARFSIVRLVSTKPNKKDK